MPFGLLTVDAVLHSGGLALGALHEIVGAGADEEDGAVAAAFAAGLLGRLASRHGGPVLWCLATGDLYAPGLAARGLAPERLIVARCRDESDIWWAMEEGLRSAALAGVLGEIGRLAPTAGRRLQLACEASGVTGFVLRRWRTADTAASQRAAPSAAVTRWRVAAAPGRASGEPLAGPQVPLTATGGTSFRREPGLGLPLWRVELVRCRGGVPGAWLMEESDATGHVALAAELADRPAAAHFARVG